MNKSLFGYKAGDVDSEIELLVGQRQNLLERNDYLEEQIKMMSRKIEEANVRISEAESYVERYKAAYEMEHKKLEAYQKVLGAIYSDINQFINNEEK